MAREDDIGLFWEDHKESYTTKIFAPPPIPDTGWKPPTYLPDLSRAAYVSLDTETYDPNLMVKGPGWATNDGYVLGVSIATPDWRGYLPLGEGVGYPFGECNHLPREQVIAWLKDTLHTNTVKVGANLMYDYGWLSTLGIEPRGQLIDVQYAEALLDEYRSVNLDDLAYRYLGVGKESNALYEWLATTYGGEPNGKQRANLYRAPLALVGPYAEADAYLPPSIYELQHKALVTEGLLDLFNLECRLIPLLLKMRRNGVRVDTSKAEQVYHSLTTKVDDLYKQLKAYYPKPVSVYSAEDAGAILSAQGIKFDRTPTGKPSITKNFLKTIDHPAAKLIAEIKRYDKIASTFIKGYILEGNVNGRIHCEFHQLRGDRFGARPGRFSSSNPNLQNIPKRDKELGPMMRGLFIPDHSSHSWRRYDYSQIEYRFLTHYAVGRGSDEARANYVRDPKTDYHDMTQETIAKTGKELDRDPTKNINFGLVYGMTKPTLAVHLGVTQAVCNELFDTYHNALPFVKETFDAASREAEAYGYTTTILGRRSRFDTWEPISHKAPGLPYNEAVAQYGTMLRRSGLYRALNRKLQGSAADQMKKAMVDCYEAGLFDECLPLVTVHDELDFNDQGGKDETFNEIKHTMETCLELRVPVIVEGEKGPNWGNCKEPV